MRKLWIAGLTGALALASCATAPETRVTRFHLGQPIAPGQIAVEPLMPVDRGSPEYQTYAGIVAAQLARIGFTEAPGLKASEQVAVIQVDRGTREALAQRSPVSIGIGGGVGGGGYRGGGVGLGGGISFPIGKSRSNEIVMTRLVVQIKRRSEGTVIWEGRAETAASISAPDARPAAAVQRLATALFQGFPGESGRTITVK